MATLNLVLLVYNGTGEMDVSIKLPVSMMILLEAQISDK